MEGFFSVAYTAVTDVGAKRTDNEDNCHCGTLWDDRHILAIVVDGVGGYAGGEVAARIAVERTTGYLERYRDGERSRLLAEALADANNSIFRMRASEDRLYRMCCVMTAALFDLEQGCIYMAHAGDTRMYAFSEGRIIKLSHDHSPVGRDEESGLLTEQEAMRHPFRNMLDRAVGESVIGKDNTLVETNVFPMGKGITWMLCSDGLCDMITSAQMSSILGGDGTVDEKARELTDAANAAGGRDNITVVLVSSTESPDEDTAQVMDDYARSVMPERETADDMTQIESDEMAQRAEDTVITEPEEVQIVQPDRDTPAGAPAPIQEEVRQKAPTVRRFPWTPFLLFLLTVLLAGVIGWFYSGFSSTQQDTVPSLQQQQEQRERLYYNIYNNRENH